MSHLPRLQAVLARKTGDVEVDLLVERGLDGRVRLGGELSADLVLQCQRCLGPLSLPLAVEIDTVLLTGSSQEDVFDGIELCDDELLLHDLIEDELLLALPAVAAHSETQDCRQGEAPQKYLLQNGEVEKANPFAALKDLKLNKPSTR